MQASLGFAKVFSANVSKITISPKFCTAKVLFYTVTHLITISINPSSYSVVFHKMTKPAASYVMSKDLELDQVNEFVRMQVSEGFTPLASNSRPRYSKWT